MCTIDPLNIVSLCRSRHNDISQSARSFTLPTFAIPKLYNNKSLAYYLWNCRMQQPAAILARKLPSVRNFFLKSWNS